MPRLLTPLKRRKLVVMLPRTQRLLTPLKRRKLMVMLPRTQRLLTPLKRRKLTWSCYARDSCSRR